MAIEPDDIEALAGEYVLGTLDAAERRAAEARIHADAGFRAAVAAWEARFQPLTDTAVPVEPPVDLFDRIVARLPADAAAPGPEVIQLHRRLIRWRFATGLAAAAAVVCLAIALHPPGAPAGRYVATLTPEGGVPGFVLAVDMTNHTLTVTRLAAVAPQGKSYQLWAIEPDKQPRSLGVVEQARYEQPLAVPVDKLTLAVSLEPEGGSPTGAPTGPVVFSGPLVQAN